MKKIIIAALLAFCITVSSFAEFEFEFGLIGGIGPAAELGLNLQLGYLSPKGTPEKPASFRWGLLTDFGIGLRYKYLNDPYDEYTWVDSGNKHTGSFYMNNMGYNMGLLGEYYFFPVMGVAIGGGVALGAGSGSDEGIFTPYFRAEIPFLFQSVKIGVGFDYIFWGSEPVPDGITLPPGYRINFFLRVRGPDALGFLLAWFS